MSVQKSDPLTLGALNRWLYWGHNVMALSNQWSCWKRHYFSKTALKYSPTESQS